MLFVTYYLMVCCAHVSVCLGACVFVGVCECVSMPAHVCSRVHKYIFVYVCVCMFTKMATSHLLGAGKLAL